MSALLNSPDFILHIERHSPPVSVSIATPPNKQDCRKQSFTNQKNVFNKAVQQKTNNAQRHFETASPFKILSVCMGGEMLPSSSMYFITLSYWYFWIFFFFLQFRWINSCLFIILSKLSNSIHFKMWRLLKLLKTPNYKSLPIIANTDLCSSFIFQPAHWCHKGGTSGFCFNFFFDLTPSNLNVSVAWVAVGYVNSTPCR